MQPFGCNFHVNLFLASRSTVATNGLRLKLSSPQLLPAFGEEQFLKFDDATSQTSVFLVFSFFSLLSSLHVNNVMVLKHWGWCGVCFQVETYGYDTALIP